MSEPQVDGDAAGAHRRGRAGRAAHLLAGRWTVTVLLIVSIVMVSYLMWRVQDQVECNAEYNDRKAAADAARAEAAEADRQALVKMVRQVVEPPAGDAQAALEEYVATLEATDRKRRENPVPAPPPNLCR